MTALGRTHPDLTKLVQIGFKLVEIGSNFFNLAEIVQVCLKNIQFGSNMSKPDQICSNWTKLVPTESSMANLNKTW